MPSFLEKKIYFTKDGEHVFLKTILRKTQKKFTFNFLEIMKITFFTIPLF